MVAWSNFRVISPFHLTIFIDFATFEPIILQHIHTIMFSLLELSLEKYPIESACLSSLKSTSRFLLEVNYPMSKSTMVSSI